MGCNPPCDAACVLRVYVRANALSGKSREFSQSRAEPVCILKGTFSGEGTSRHLHVKSCLHIVTGILITMMVILVFLIIIPIAKTIITVIERLEIWHCQK